MKTDSTITLFKYFVRRRSECGGLSQQNARFSIGVPKAFQARVFLEKRLKSLDGETQAHGAVYFFLGQYSGYDAAFNLARSLAQLTYRGSDQDYEP